jgi:hypothetical protein
LVPGTYDVELMLLTHFGENRTRESFIIPARVECEGDDCFDIPEIVFNETFYRGALSLTAELDAAMNLSVDYYANSSSIQFYIMEIELHNFVIAEDLEGVGMFESILAGEHDSNVRELFSDLTMDYRQLLQPIFS